MKEHLLFQLFHEKIWYWLFQPSHKQDQMKIFNVIFFDVSLSKLGIEQVYFFANLEMIHILKFFFF